MAARTCGARLSEYVLWKNARSAFFHKTYLLFFARRSRSELSISNAGEFSAHLNSEGHLQDVLRAKLALFTNGSTGKDQVRRASTLGDEAPDAHALVLQGIAERRLQVQRAL